MRDHHQHNLDRKLIHQLLAETDQGHIGGSGIPIPPVGAATVGRAGFGAELGILKMSGKDVDDHDPVMVTISISAIAGVSAAQVQALGGGPLVGIVEWGSGLSSANRAEFDIPLQGSLDLVAPFSPSRGSGVTVCVPASALEIKCRNDANMITRIGDSPLGVDTPPVVTASLAIHPRGQPSKVFLTQWLISALAGAGLAIAGTVVGIPIPPFAKSVRVLRNPGRAMTVAVNGQSGTPIDGPYVVAVDTQAPILELSGSSTSVIVTNTGAGTIDKLSLLYEIGL